MNKFFTPRLQNLVAEKIVKFLGITVVLSIIGIILNLLMVSLPLFFSPTSNIAFQFHTYDSNLPKSKHPVFLEAGFLNDNFSYLTSKDGAIHFFTLDAGQKIAQIKIRPNFKGKILSLNVDNNDMITAFYSDGLGEMVKPTLKEQGGALKASLTKIQTFKFNPKGFKFGQARYYDERFFSLVINRSHKASFQTITKSTDFLGNITDTKTTGNFNIKIKKPTVFLLDRTGSKLYLANQTGFLEGWQIDDQNPRLIATEKISAMPISSATFVLGETSLFVSLEDGSQILLTPITNSTEKKDLIFQFRNFNPPAKDKTIFTSLQSSKINRTILGKTHDNQVLFIYTTTGKELLKINHSGPIVDFRVDEYQENLAILSENGHLTIYHVNIPFPEVSFSAFFKKIFYESYPKPEYVWQSSSGQDDFEPKLSLIPLIVGSFKGTLYAMILVVPLSILGAIYLSQFSSVKVRQTVKPIIEVMSSIPSVVVGFLAALWLAPNLEKYFLQFVLLFPFLGLFYWLSYHIWFGKVGILRKIKTEGWEFLLAIPTILLSLFAASRLGPYLSDKYFDKNFVIWLYENLDIKYEQQNAIVTAAALGFATMPLIFTITDDALNSVPSTFKVGSLALGASKWQTVWRVIVPAASPGIFAAFILGTSRAIGETMIVLMASGNTPITDLNLFSGMRTLSANIAVEMPEAPVGGTLYRTLFLSALLLFFITFVFNFLAEVIRHRLHKQYGRL